MYYKAGLYVGEGYGRTDVDGKKWHIPKYRKPLGWPADRRHPSRGFDGGHATRKNKIKKKKWNKMKEDAENKVAILK